MQGLVFVLNYSFEQGRWDSIHLYNVDCQSICTTRFCAGLLFRDYRYKLYHSDCDGLCFSFVDVMTALAALFLVVSRDKLVLLPTSLDNVGVVQSFKDLCRHAFGASKWDGTKQRGCIIWSNWCSWGVSLSILAGFHLIGNVQIGWGAGVHAHWMLPSLLAVDINQVL